MPKIKIFFDSSAFVAGVISQSGAARVLLTLAEIDEINIYISDQVIVETERALARKSPRNLTTFREIITLVHPIIVKENADDVQKCLYMISDPTDAPILAAAMKSGVNYLVTHNRKHFLDDPNVAERSGLQIGTPGDALAWLRGLV